MKTIFTSFLILFLCLETNAQEVLTGPHAGRMKIAQGYRIEALGCDNYMEVYLYNEANEPIFNNGISGEVSFFLEKKTVKETLVAYGIDGFTCKITSPDFSHYIVTLDLLDKLIISASFNECVVPKQ
jgi:hypothetical protein